MLLQRRNNQKGFTILELLVIIAIIGLISSIAVYFLNSARIKARDAKRKSDVSQIVKALTLYFDEYQVYPALSGSNPAGVDDWLFGQGLQPYLNPIPRDPSCRTGSSCNYQIQYDGSQSAFAIQIPFEELTVCKIVSVGASPGSFFASTPVCSY